MKKILLVGPPFSGHLHPLLGIARELQAHAAVTLLSTPTGVRAATTAGLAGREILATREPQIWRIAEPDTGVRNHPLKLWRQLQANVALMGEMKCELDAIFREERPDLVIADFVVPVAGLAATALGIPWWTTLPSPCVFETPDGPPAYFGGQTPATTLLQRLRHAAMRRATRGFKRTMGGLFRREFRALGFPGIYRADGSEAVYSPQRILALSIPEIEFPRRYPPHFEFTGPVLYTPPFAGDPPVFSGDGRPQVLISIGTHLPHAKRALADALAAIARRRPEIVFHFTHGKAGAAPCQRTGNFHEYDFISYADHLPRYDLVVHHGGAGVMHHCLRHAVPAVVHPQDYDQFDHAARLVAAGLALPAKRAADLEGAILAALHDAGLKRRCQEMSRIHAGYSASRWIAEQAIGR